MANNGYDSSSSDETGANIMFLKMFKNYQRKKAAKKKEKTSMVVHGDFRNRFRMRRELFNLIMKQIVLFDDYFKQKPNATGKLGFSPQVKMTAAMRMLAYGTTADLNDDYLKIAETTSFEACKRFCHAVNNLYRAEYLRKSTRADLQKLLQKVEEHGFHGMLGSLDYMHWEWTTWGIHGPPWSSNHNP
ncbi:uncharacterized protein LOC109949704 [Prunus persica]|uniref:uncharacterized protein LOC109949704 n=1 Tax=Prunus persica TaxID=3760 RepID=UPI0009AB5FBB|nr:uncharacterized protein LOC109949704 [Prunus persica]